MAAFREQEEGLPLYEYECAKCHRRFELIEKVDAKKTRKCPKCGGKAERLFPAPAIQFKGSGWYVTDYAGKGRSPSKGEKTEGSEKTASAESKPKKTEKPAAKSKDK